MGERMNQGIDGTFGLERDVDLGLCLESKDEAIFALGLMANGATPKMNDGAIAGTNAGTNTGASVAMNAHTIFAGNMLAVASNQGSGLFSGRIVSVALNPQPEPPIFKIGAKTGMGLFSGRIVKTAINPQPEPPGISTQH